MKPYRILFALLLLWVSKSSYGQKYLLDSIKTNYNFVNWKANEIKFAEKSPAFKALYKRLNNVVQAKEEDIHIFHIGGSHIQADIYSNRLRSYLQHMSPTAKGQRGFIYPYRMAKTNNPGNYKVEYDGEWKGFRCSILKDSIAWGLSGVTAVFKDSISHVKVDANYVNYDKKMYNFNKLRVFYDDWSEDYQLKFTDSTLITHSEVNKEGHYIEYAFNDTVESVEFDIERIGTPEESEFLMMGLELMNDRKGIEYTSIGVNGASFAYYNRCKYFEDQLMLYKPDLFIVSIGTNDTYTTEFDDQEFKNYYENLIKMILKANPRAAILLTVPNDSYYKRKYPNPNTRIARKVIYDLAHKYCMAVWDFYEIMGGFNSSKAWYENDLMPKDRIHFTRLGYRIKADLLLEALTNSWERSLGLQPRTVLKQIINE
ncbi:DUF459 domain-containing protein [Aquimarina rhabdastrellae]